MNVHNFQRPYSFLKTYLIIYNNGWCIFSTESLTFSINNIVCMKHVKTSAAVKLENKWETHWNCFQLEPDYLLKCKLFFERKEYISDYFYSQLNIYILCTCLLYILYFNTKYLKKRQKNLISVSIRRNECFRFKILHKKDWIFSLYFPPI